MFILINLGETNYFICLYMKLLTGIKKRNFKLLFFFHFEWHNEIVLNLTL